MLMSLAGEYVSWVQSNAHAESDPGAVQPIVIESPQGQAVEQNAAQGMVAPMNGSDGSSFFVFFTGANGASMIIHEGRRRDASAPYSPPHAAWGDFRWQNLLPF